MDGVGSTDSNDPCRKRFHLFLFQPTDEQCEGSESIDLIRYANLESDTSLPEVEVVIAACDWLSSGGDQIFIERSTPILVTDANNVPLLVTDAVALYLQSRVQTIPHHTFLAEKCWLHDISLPDIEGRLKPKF